MSLQTEEWLESPEVTEALCFGRAWPLPQLREPPHLPEDHYEVVVAGGGIAGLFLTLLLARYGLGEKSLLCIDAKENANRIGHADGINGRTIEILATLGLEAEVVRNGNAFTENAFWAKSPDSPTEVALQGRGIFNFAPCRFAQLKTLHQGRLEHTLLEDLAKYHKGGVQYSTSILDVKVDEEDSEYPVLVTIESKGSQKTIRTKYLVGADGAHSLVRRAMGIGLDGDIVDTVWGVIDFIADTNFPDIRRLCNLTGASGHGDGLIVPRERLSNGEYLTRIYLDMSQQESDPNQDEEIKVNHDETRRKRAEITPEKIMDRMSTVVHPYKLEVKQGTKAFWSASYSVGQRLANQFAIADSQGHPRVFLIGDAAHTHSPRQGQGLNISMSDAHNISWKLAYSLFQLAPHPDRLLHTYSQERRPTAERVVYFDKRWNQTVMSREEVFQEMREQVISTGVEYASNLIVDEKQEVLEDKDTKVPVQGTQYLEGILRVGRRLLNARLKRSADGTMCDVHEDLRSDGRWRVLVLASKDFVNRDGRSVRAVEHVLVKVLGSHVRGLLEPIIVHPELEEEYTWETLPSCVKEKAEMRLYCAASEVYSTYGVSELEGAVVLVRPDGMVALIARLEDVERVDELLRGALRVEGSRE